MRKLTVILVAVLVAISASAQVGVVGGITSSSTRIKDIDAKNITLYHAGLLYKIPLSGGFAIQPELLYNVKGSKYQPLADISELDVKTGFLEAGAQIQWGVNIDEVHPYVFAEPFAGYALNTSVSGEKVTDWSGIQRFEYGLALGFGVEFLKHVQLSAKYFWNIGESYDISTFYESVKSAKISGVAISAAILF